MALTAVCVFMGQLFGTIILKEQGDGLLVQGSIGNLSEGSHGFHIHEFGDVRQGCVAAGSHFNPFNEVHGAPTDEHRHVGDFGNIDANAEGNATIDTVFHTMALLHGETSVVGRAIVVHALRDDLGKGDNEESKKTGNAGARLDCCVIGLAKGD